MTYGYDQSPTMAGGVLRWAGRQWFDSHIAVGMPTGTLPYGVTLVNNCFTGSPRETGAFSFTVQGTDNSTAQPATKTFTLRIGASDQSGPRSF